MNKLELWLRSSLIVRAGVYIAGTPTKNMTKRFRTASISQATPVACVLGNTIIGPG